MFRREVHAKIAFSFQCPSSLLPLANTGKQTSSPTKGEIKKGSGSALDGWHQIVVRQFL
jgi:hypothetical protein